MTTVHARALLADTPAVAESAATVPAGTPAWSPATATRRPLPLPVVVARAVSAAGRVQPWTEVVLST